MSIKKEFTPEDNLDIAEKAIKDAFDVVLSCSEKIVKAIKGEVVIGTENYSRLARLQNLQVFTAACLHVTKEAKKLKPAPKVKITNA